jgi:hypothetical protein
VTMSGSKPVMRMQQIIAMLQMLPKIHLLEC